MPDPICIWSGSALKHWPEAGQMILANQLASDQICLAKTWYSQSEPNQIQAGFAQYDLGNLWKTATESERGKLVAGQLCFARIGPDDSCTLACFQTRCIWPKHDRQFKSDLGWFWMIWSRPSLEKKKEPNQMWEVRSTPNLAAHWLKWPQLDVTKMLLNQIQHVYWEQPHWQVRTLAFSDLILK